MKESILKNTHDKSYLQMFGYGLALELLLVITQFVYALAISAAGPGGPAGFTDNYMRETGFMLFQIIGFFVFAVASYFLLLQLRVNVFSKMLAFLVTGSLVELAFYLSMQADFTSIFLLSIFDKFPAAAYGAIAIFVREQGVAPQAR